MTLEPKRDLIAVREKLAQRYGRAPSYSQLWVAAANGRIPARRVGRGWVIADDDLAAVAEHFRLKPLVPTSAA
jgi:hypothetical protein